jgi:2-aminophenol/2-amino-5-chlorophenol 1,6-dioxygenase beta subunit
MSAHQTGSSEKTMSKFTFQMPRPAPARTAPSPGPSQPTRTYGSPEVLGGAASGAARPSGGIVAGFLAPHPPHLIYAENPPQNEPRSTGGWEVMRWAYEKVRQTIREELKPDVIVVHAPHWITMVGHHVNCVARPKGRSVEPIFPHLFRYDYEFATDVELATAIADEGASSGLVMRKMDAEGVRVDYATIGALHLLNPQWDIPVVSMSANNNPYFYSEASLDEMEVLGEATRRAIEATGRRAVLAGSNTLSHLHWDVEPDLPEDMSKEHPYSNEQYRHDMDLLSLMRAGDARALRKAIPEHITATASETKAGSLSWMLSALGWPTTPATVHAYTTIIGTGNALVEWRPDRQEARRG